MYLQTTLELVAISSALVWAISAFLIRSQTATMTPAAINTVRCLAAGVMFWLLLPFDTPSSSLVDLSWLEWLLLVGSVLCNIVLGDTFSIVAIKEIGLSRSMPLTGTFPLATIFFEVLLLGHELQLSLLVGTLFLVGGIAFLSRQPRGSDAGELGSVRVGILFAIAASLMWGLGTILLKLAVTNMTIIQANSMRMPMVAMLLLATRVIPAGRVGLRSVSLRALVIVALSGLIGMGLGSYLYLSALNGLGPSKTATLTSSYPVFGLLLALLFKQERVTAATVAGLVSCLLGVWIVV